MGGTSGDSSSKYVTTYSTVASYLPSAAQAGGAQSVSDYMAMPSSLPISYGGTTFQAPTKGPLYGSQMAQALYSPTPSYSGGYSYTTPGYQFCGMSCFMFVEAERDEKLRELRWFRDSHFPRGCTVQSGYSKMSRFIIPLMRKSRLFKKLIQLVMTSPLIAFAKWYYKKNKYGFIFYPLAWMWRNVWWTIGKLVPIREYTWKEFYEVTKETRYDILYSPNIQ